jgi:hypothetical protein
MLGQVSGSATAGYAASFSLSPKHDFQQYLGIHWHMPLKTLMNIPRDRLASPHSIPPVTRMGLIVALR